MNVVHVQQLLPLVNYPMHFLRGRYQKFYSGCLRKGSHFTTKQLLIRADKLPKDCGSQLKNLEPRRVFDGEKSFFGNAEHQVPDFDGHVKENAESISNPLANNEIKKYVELERRRKIGLANKGRIPWNKGRKHRPETRELIRRRIIETYRDPKFRKKMLENPRFHSAETKAKIGLTQRRRYEERMKRQRIQEKYCLIWSHSIAESAKKGSQEQQELEWDGYEKLKTVFELDYWQRIAQEAWAKEYTKLKAVGAELAKAVRNRHTEKEKEKGEKAQLKKPGRSKKKSGNSKEEEKSQLKKFKRLKKKSVDSKELSEIDGLKLKVRTMKQLMLPVPDLETVDCKTDLQKWDLKFIKQEKMRRRISFADQIKAAKGVRTISPAEEVRN